MKAFWAFLELLDLGILFKVTLKVIRLKIAYVAIENHENIHICFTIVMLYIVLVQIDTTNSLPAK